MAKQRSFHEKMIQKLKRDAGHRWTHDYVEILQDRNAKAPDDEKDPALVAAGLMGCLQHEAYVRYHDERLRRRDGRDLDEPFVYPGLSLAWESAPVAISFQEGLITACLADESLDFEGTPVPAMRDLFPACLLMDVREYGCELYDEPVDALAVYPSRDVRRGYDMLLILGFNQRCGLELPYESKLLLVGDTLGEALDATIREREVLRRRGLAGIGEELHDWIFTPYDDEEDLMFLTASLLGFMLWDGTRIDMSERRGVPHWLVRQAEPDEAPQALASPYGAWGYRRGVAVSGGGADHEAEAPTDGADTEATAEEGPEQAREIEAPAHEEAGTAGDAEESADLGESEKADATDEPGSEEPEADEQPGAEPAEPEQPNAFLAGLEQPEPEQSEPPEPEPVAVPDLKQAHEEALLQIMQLEELLAEQESKAATLEYHLKQARASADDVRKQAEGALARAAVLESLDLPATPAESLELAMRAFPDRLVALPAARKSAEEFAKGSAAEVWAVLRSMAVVLHPLVFGKVGGSITHAFQATSGFELTLREMKLIKQADKFARLRTVEYKGKQHDATAHVKGKGSKRGETLRVHFFADYDDKRIVITHCGEHLETYDTSSL